MIRTTEQDSTYRHLEQQSITELLKGMQAEDMQVPLAVQICMPQIERLIAVVVGQLQKGGRLFYIGAGTSGRLGIVDASECPPTFGVSFGLVIGIIAGGDGAIRKAVEFAEDNHKQGWLDLQNYNINKNDVVIGLSASGTTPYVLGALIEANKQFIPTGCIVCNAGSPIAQHAQYPIECVVGPEFLTGSTRLKAGTAQKLILNQISTVTMICLGRVKDNKMVDMALSNDKLIDRGAKYIQQIKGIDYEKAKALLLAKGSVRAALE